MRLRSAAAGGLVALAATLVAAHGQETPAEAALSRLLLDRPHRWHGALPGGLRGAYTNPRKVIVQQERSCVFHLFEDGLSENGDRGSDWVIDFRGVTAIGVELVDRPKLDPAVGRLYRIAPAAGKAARVTFLGASGRQNVFCHVKLCGGDTLSFLQPAAHLLHARRAAIDLRAACPGRGTRKP